MPSLTSGVSIPGSGGSISALVKSGASTLKTIDTYNDDLAKITYDDSGHDDTSYQTYVNYLNGRIAQLTAAGTITDATKALTMQQELVTANHSNISYHIQQENQSLMESGLSGTSAGYSQKMGVLSNEIQQANAVGDTTLVDSLQSQYLSAEQSYMSAVQSETTAAKTSAAAAETAIKAGYTNARTQITDSIQAMFAAMENPQASTSGKPADPVGDTIKAITDTLGTLGVNIPKGTAVNVGSVLYAAFEGQYKLNINEYVSLASSDPSSASTYAQFDSNGNLIGGDALKIVDNSSYVKVPGLGNVNAADAYNIAVVPNLVGTTNDNGVVKMHWNATTAYTVDQNGTVLRLSDGKAQADVQPTSGQQSQYMSLLKKAGFSDVSVVPSGAEKGEFKVTLSSNTDKWLNYKNANPDLSAGNGTGTANTMTFILVNGHLESKTNGGRLVSLAWDANSNIGAVESLAGGKTQVIGGQYGFNQRYNTFTQMKDPYNLEKDQSYYQTQKLLNTVHNPKGLPNLLQDTALSKPLPGSLLSAHPNAGGAVRTPTFGPNVQMVQRADGGFNFTQNGVAISAARYSQLTNTPFRTLLQQMANRGDVGAKSALNFVGNDYGYNPNQIGTNGNTYNSLVWGVMPGYSNGAKASAPAPQGSVKTANTPINIGSMSLNK